MAEGQWSGRSRHRADNRRRTSRQPLAVGWGVPDRPNRSETVVAVFAPERLSDGLARLHGQGFGPATRVLDGARGDLTGQLSRAGLPSDVLDHLRDDNPGTVMCLILVNAPARSGQASDLLERAGALAVQVVGSGALGNRPADPIVDLSTEAVVPELGA